MSLGPRRLFVVTGQTGSGKDEATARAAAVLGAHVFCMDAIKVYRRMEVGTDKPSPEWRARLRYHGLDLVEPWESFNVGRFLRTVEAELAEISPETPVLFCGGTGLYLRALVHGLFEGPPADPEVRARILRDTAKPGGPTLHGRLTSIDAEAAARIHANDEKRLVRALEVFELTGRPITELQRERTRKIPGVVPVLIGVRRDPAWLRSRIVSRARRMVAAGLLAEVDSIEKAGGFSREAGEALGYRQAIEVRAGRLAEADLADTISRETWRFARRQATWFRSFSEIDWIAGGEEAGELSSQELAREIVRRSLL